MDTALFACLVVQFLFRSDIEPLSDYPCLTTRVQHETNYTLSRAAGSELQHSFFDKPHS